MLKRHYGLLFMLSFVNPLLSLIIVITLSLFNLPLGLFIVLCALSGLLIGIFTEKLAWKIDEHEHEKYYRDKL